MARTHTTKGSEGVLRRYSAILGGQQPEMRVSYHPETNIRCHDAVEADIDAALKSLAGRRPQEAIAVLHDHDIDAIAVDSDSATR
jgi:hypothetical protein